MHAFSANWVYNVVFQTVGKPGAGHMVQQLDAFLYKFRFALFGMVTVGCLLAIVTLLFGTSASAACLAAGTSGPAATSISGGSDSANAVAAGMSAAADSFMRTMDTVGHRASCNTQAIAATFAGGTRTIGTAVGRTLSVIGTGIAHGTQTALTAAGHGIRAGALFTARAVTGGIAFIAHSVGSIFGFFSHIPLLGAVVEPAAHAQVPVIDTGSPIPLYVAAAAPVAKTIFQPATPANVAAIWPIHGAITTEFGVPEPPYQPIHTGLDISDGQPSGITPIHPFKPGRVSQVVRGSTGLGNHVVVDNGNGITSVYGHLYSVSVQEGQQVDQSTVLGLEGSTGASTGTHLHFEIRVNGQPVDPHRYIGGQP